MNSNITTTTTKPKADCFDCCGCCGAELDAEGWCARYCDNECTCGNESRTIPVVGRHA